MKVPVFSKTVEAIYLVVSDGSEKSGDGDEEQKDAARGDAADYFQAGDHVGGLPVGRHPDQQKGHHLEKHTYYRRL